MFWILVLLVGVVVAIVWIVRGRKPAPPPSTSFDDTPVPTDWGRQTPPPAQPPSMDGRMMGGLATGLALGAGAIAAQ